MRRLFVNNKHKHVNLTDVLLDLTVQVTITRTSSVSDDPRLRHHQLTMHTPFFSLHYEQTIRFHKLNAILLV
jgi:hypothetical protein